MNISRYERTEREREGERERERENFFRDEIVLRDLYDYREK
jgi:hypothetical protein